MKNEETTIKNVLIKYTCAAYPPFDIDMNNIYTFGKDENGFYYSFLDVKEYADIELIKMLFTPKDKTWEEIIK